MLLVKKQKPSDELHTNRVESWYRDIKIILLRVNLIVRNCFSPLLPLFLLGAVAVVVNRAFRRIAKLVRDYLAKFVIELLTTLSCGGNTDGPDNRENEKMFHHLLKLFDILLRDLLDLTFMVISKVAVQNAQLRLNQIVVHSDYWLRAVSSHELETFSEVLLKVAVKSRQKLFCLLECVWAGFDPRINEWLISNSTWLQVNHTATRHSGRGSDSKVLDFKHHCHLVSQVDDLARVKAKLFVVVQHSVHVFNPKSIDWPIKDDPVLVKGFISSTVLNHLS
jgi:hypothetical protein